MMRWYAVNTQPRAEARALTNLVRQEFTAYLPRLSRSVRHARKVTQIAAPLFPAYLFVAIDTAHQPWSAINGTFGVRQLVMAGTQPAPVPVGFVEALQATGDSEGMLPTPGPDRLEPGHRVEIIAGGFAEQIATILSLGDRDRVVVLMRLLGRDVRTTLPVTHLRKVV